MNLTDRDKRALVLLAIVGVLMFGYWWSSDDDTVAVVSGAASTIPGAEKQLRRLRELAAMVPGKEQALGKVMTELRAREQGLIQADTAAQAQAQLLQIARKIAKSQAIDLRNTEIGQVKPFGDGYGEVLVAVNFDSRIEQLINFLSDITAQRQLIGTTDLRIGSANPKQKTMPVRLTLSALVRRDLVPEKKGAGAF